MYHSEIKIAAVDATEHGSLADKYDVKGYPTLKFFPKGSTTPVEYDGGRTADTIVSWINNKIGTSRKVKHAPSHVVALTAETFDETVLGSKAALVEFYAPWCGHCKSLAPKYEVLAKAFAGESDVVIAKVDATEEPELASRFEISGYPTLKFFPAGSADAEAYEGQREVEAMVDFINLRAGTLRNSDGTLKPTAGRVAKLDELISGAKYNVDAALVNALKVTAATLDGKDAGLGKLYISAAEKVLAKGAEYVTKEIARLEKMSAGSNVKPDAKTSMQLRRNVLTAFAASANEEL